MTRRWLGLSVGALSFAYLILILNPIQALSALVYPVSPALCRRINRWCARSIWGFWLVLGELVLGIRFRWTGDEVPPRENAVLLPNHQTMADVLVLMALGWRAGRLADMKWFVKNIVKYFPGFGWGMYFLDCVFLRRSWSQDQEHIRKLFAKYRRDGIPVFLVSFLEGTRITPAKLLRAQRYAQEGGAYVPQHTLVPRSKGFGLMMLELGSHLDAVYDITIAYPEGPPTLVQCYEGKVRAVDVHVVRYPISELPKDAEGLRTWVLAGFEAKDRLLEAYHQNGGVFPGPVRERPIRLSEWFRAERRMN
jgi:1-acyl-sn-glycerol-3-phosphate acyltransferase